MKYRVHMKFNDHEHIAHDILPQNVESTLSTFLERVCHIYLPPYILILWVADGRWHWLFPDPVQYKVQPEDPVDS